MTVVALTAIVTVTQKNGTVEHEFQNGKHGGIGDYDYLSFIYQGAAMNRTGDNLEASLILGNTSVSMGFVHQFVEERYYVEVETHLMDENFNKKQTIPLTKEYWLASGMRYDPESIELLLSSPVDAVGANVPQKTLSTEQCKQLPLTGTIQNR